MLRVRLLGDLTLEVDGSRVELPTSRRARSLLGWLALDRRMHARSVLAARFWPDVLDESARTSLRSALSALRRALGPDSERYLIANRDEVGLADERAVWTDVAEFDRRVADGRLEEALELCRGELLGGLDDDWVHGRRDEHRDRVASVLGRLAARAESDGDLRAAIAFTRRQAALDPFAEEPERDLMRRLAAAGDRAAAIRAYERFSRRLREELRIAPSQATRELAETLRNGTVGLAPAPAGRVATARRLAPPPALAVDEGTALVGRGAQLEELGRRWHDARVGRRRVAMLAGEPGIGKTRLAAEFCRKAYAEGATVLLGRCYEESLVPYQPFVEALGHYAAESRLDELLLVLGPQRAILARLLPELHAPEPAIRSSTDDPERERFLLFDAVASLLREVSAANPLILGLDDLHWADASTLLMLRHLARCGEHWPLLILGTYRESEVDPAHPLAQALAELRRARALDSLTIEGLGEAEVAALISASTGREAPATFTRAILDRTEGNPFFVEEILREVADEDDWVAALARVGVPESVNDVLLRRLRRLDDPCRRVLTLAAVSGREFALDVLARLSDMTADQIAECLEQAIAARVIDESPGQIGRYGFAHALIRETIYEQLSHTRRAQLHRQVGEAIEAACAGALDQQVSALAYHFSAAGDVAKAYEFHSRAAAGARHVHAIEPALAHYTAALEAGVALGLHADAEPAIRDLFLQRGRMRIRTGDDAGAGEDLEAALDGARRSGDRAIEMETLNELGILRLRSDLGAAARCHEAALVIAQELDDTAAQTNALDRLSVISSHRLELDRGLELGERSLALARRTGDPSLVGRAMDSIKLAALHLGDLPRLDALTRDLEPIWRGGNDLWYLQWTLLESAFVPMGAGRWDEAERRLADAAAVNRRVRDPAAEAMILDALCWLHRGHGDYEDALSAGRRAVTAGACVGWEGWTAATLASALLDLWAPAPAAAVLEHGLAAAERLRAPNEITRCLGQLAWARWLLGAREQATSLAARAQRLLEQVTAPAGGAFLFGAHAYTAVARVHLAAGAPERGVALLLPVRAAAERSGWKEAIAATELVLGLCLEARGEHDQAAALLAHAAATADEHGIPAPAWEAHEALARMHRLAGRPGEADEQHAMTEAIVERATAGLKDEALRAGVRERARR
jgi:DNA-binding SARP family transcriptional activator/tetratricopeptide (TPR) repeat protein